MYNTLSILILVFLVGGCGAAPRNVEVIEEETKVSEEVTEYKGGANLISLGTDAQLNDLIASGKLVVVDFFATWCGPCKRLTPIFEKVSAEFPNVIFVKIDVDQFRDLSSKYGIQSVPSIKIFANKNASEPVQQFGPVSAAEFRKILQGLGA